MGILVNEHSRILVQGITGQEGSFHARACRTYGTNVVAGVTPGKGGQLFDGEVPIFDSVEQAINEQQANVSLIFVPPPFAADAIVESADAGIPLIACITEGIPVQDRHHARRDTQTRPSWSCLKKWNVDLRSRRSTNGPGYRPIKLCRDRRRPHYRHELR